MLLWYNSGGPHNDVTEQPRDRMHLRDARRREFAQLQQWGIKGVKVDFWQSDKQDRIQQYLDLLRDAALSEIDSASAPAARLLQGNVVYGAAFIEDPDLPDRGTTLVFGWPEPLAPATWPWQASWVVGDSQDDDEDQGSSEELDLYDAGELAGDESMLAELADELSCGREDARTALREAALALTRASLLAGVDDGEDDEADDDQANGTLGSG